MTGRGEVTFIGRDTEAVDLGVGVLYRSRADARKGFPESGVC